MRLLTYEKRNTLRLGAWVNGYVLDAQTALRCCPDVQDPGGELEAACGSMMALLNAAETAWKALRAAHDYYRRITEQQSGLLLRQGILSGREDVTLHAPLPAPGKVICVAANYPGPGATQKPSYPTIFLKPPSTVTGPDMPVWVTDLTQNVAYEVELAVVVGQRAHQVAASQAWQHIAGYTLANDVGDRLLEKRTSQWTSGKMFDSFTPMGPWLVTPDEVSTPGALEMRTQVNGELVQKGSTADMFFNIPGLIHILSTLTTLLPGDVILTGSPKMLDGEPAPGVALKPGDKVTIEIEGLGALTNPIDKEP